MSIELAQQTELIAFDYDGTAAVERGAVPDAMVEGVKAIHGAGIATSMITARPYKRLLAVCGGIVAVNRIVSADHPLATERGGRIVGHDRTTNLEYNALNPDELDAIADLRPDNVDYVVFYPEAPSGDSLIWSPDPAKRAAMKVRFGAGAVILREDKTALGRSLREARPCQVMLRFKAPDTSNRDAIAPELNAAWEGSVASIVAEGINKSSALKSLCEITGIPVHETRYAGNDTSDLPILCNPALRERIFVGDKPLEGMADPVTKLATPVMLGHHLLRIAQNCASV
ncbi:MAG TPA: HAD hydrolase family protein [Patescibacteria group bacterium]|nr:HAD hydrolase family protein [Patescibacteria group bacterium]